MKKIINFLESLTSTELDSSANVATLNKSSDNKAKELSQEIKNGNYSIPNAPSLEIKNIIKAGRNFSKSAEVDSTANSSSTASSSRSRGQKI